MPEITVEVIPVFKDVVITWATLFVLYLILNKILYDPLTNFLEKRRSQIDENVVSAKEQNEKALQLKQEYEKKLQEAQNERQELLSEARNRGIDIKEEIIHEARKEAEAIKERAYLDIEQEKAHALKSLQDETADMAVMIASKLIDKEITKEDNDKIIDQFIKEVGN